jgi:hypothetical protein
MLQKQALNIDFAMGLDQKTDPWQIAPNNFLQLQNSVFTTGKRLTKRNGYQPLAALPNTSSTYLTTLNDNLTAVGTSILAYNETNSTWVSRGSIQPMQINTLPLIRNNINQTQCDAAVSASGLVCTVYTEINNSTSDYKYAVADSITGQNIVIPTLIPGTVTGSPRVFVLGNYFVIVYTTGTGAASVLKYISVSIVTPTVVTSPANIASVYSSNPALSWDGYAFGSQLYIAYDTTAGGQSVKVTYLTELAAATGGAPVAASTFAGLIATLMTVTVDVSIPSTPIVWVNFYNLGTSLGFALAVDQNLNTVLSPTATITATNVLNIASAAQNGICTMFYEVNDNYGYDTSIPTHYVASYTIPQVGTPLTNNLVVRSVGLASKAFIVNGVIYFLSEYQSQYQCTYFLIDGSTSTHAMPVIAGKLAYSNGGGPVAVNTAYLPLGLPSVTVLNGNDCYVSYLYKDLIAAVNKGTALPSGTQTAGIYSQDGINLATFIIGTQDIDTAEIGSDLLVTGGFLWMYDGYLPVEQNFFVWPDNVEAAWTVGSGNVVAEPPGWVSGVPSYYYQVTYEWTDNQGNAYRSAPSIPTSVITGSGTTGSITLKIPTLRLTYKISNPVKIVIYRWSVGQQVYYQTTSITAPIINDTTIDYVTYVDSNSDATIIGNNIIYTNGGVVEDVNGPASNIFTLFDTRFWMVDAEDKNLLWFSKQVIESTPVEMSDLFTFYIAPTQAAQGSTGPITALAPMYDKLIIFKANAIYYINGTGPDNTGSNNQYSQPIFITSTVGCANQSSIVFQPSGLMFQSDKGIWLLGRDLSTSYIGAGVEAFNSSVVQSAVNVPDTNQVRFTLNAGQTLMFDYYYNQWGTFVGVPAISSCIYHGFHTFLNAFGAVYQEQVGSYLDGSNPVLLGLTSAWFNLTGIQGYQRAFFFYLLGEYFSPHKLQMSIAYDYNPAPSQVSLITPTNYNPPLGTDSPLGQGTPYGGQSNVLDWRIFLTRQRCESFQVSLQEVYDASFGVPAGQGLALSGINLVYASKQKFRPQPARHSIGGGTK